MAVLGPIPKSQRQHGHGVRPFLSQQSKTETEVTPRKCSRSLRSIAALCYGYENSAAGGCKKARRYFGICGGAVRYVGQASLVRVQPKCGTDTNFATAAKFEPVPGCRPNAGAAGWRPNTGLLTTRGGEAGEDEWVDLTKAAERSGGGNKDRPSSGGMREKLPRGCQKR